MSEQLLFCADNLFCRSIYPGHSAPTADSEAAGFEGYRVGSARRHASYRWQSGTANAEHYIQSTFDQLRGFDFFALER